MGRLRIKHKWVNGIELKQCSTCKEWLLLGCFHKDKNKWDDLRNQCKTCVKQYYQDNFEQITEKQKQYRQTDREQIKQYRKDNHEQLAKYQKQYRKDNNKKAEQHRQSLALYDTYAHRIGFCEEVRRASDNPELLEVKCAYCGKWLKSTKSQVKNRLQVFNGTQSGEKRFYCSKNCKQSCPIYRQVKYPKGFKQATSREVVPLLRQLVLKRDNYKCQKCGATTKTSQLHVHHIIPYAQNKMQADDPDSCITLCKSCHKEVHQQDGCKYHELKCKQ